MTEQAKQRAADIIDAPSVRIEDERFNRWLHMTMYYAAVGQGIAPSHAAIGANITAMRIGGLDGAAQLRYAIDLLRKSGLNIDAVHKELGR